MGYRDTSNLGLSGTSRAPTCMCVLERCAFGGLQKLLHALRSACSSFQRGTMWIVGNRGGSERLACGERKLMSTSGCSARERGESTEA